MGFGLNNLFIMTNCIKTRPYCLNGFFLVAFMAIVSCVPSHSGAGEFETPHPEFLNHFLAAKPLAHASVGLLAVDMQTGTVLAMHNSDKSLVPASIQKLMIAGAALETFGNEHTFLTTLLLDGLIDSRGVLRGDIIINGGGDPALGSPRYEKHYREVVSRFAQSVKKAGITKVDGQVIGDGSFFGQQQIPDTWLWEDIGNYYGATATGLNLYENAYRLNLRSGKPGSLTELLNTDPFIPGLRFENRVTASLENRDNAYIFGSYLSEHREIRGTIPHSRNSFTIRGAIPDPAFLVAFQLTELLGKSGIAVSGEPISSYQKRKYQNPDTLMVIESPPLSDLVNLLNMKSINLYAESLLLHLAGHAGKTISMESGCEALLAFWKEKGMEISGLFLEDASGLSRANVLTPEQMVFVLRYMKNHGAASEVFLSSLPVSGVSGGMKNFGDEAMTGKFRAKTGYMNRVMNYAGYLTRPEGGEVIIVIMVNNYTCSNQEMKGLIEELISGIYYYP
jgi:serine-type D-Ala-D-Ala carboxypeptidase/endopeptidase (penicillin-binding protein 4)